MGAWFCSLARGDALAEDAGVGTTRVCCGGAWTFDGGRKLGFEGEIRISWDAGGWKGLLTVDRSLVHVGETGCSSVAGGDGKRWTKFPFRRRLVSRVEGPRGTGSRYDVVRIASDAPRRGLKHGIR